MKGNLNAPAHKLVYNSMFICHFYTVSLMQRRIVDNVFFLLPTYVILGFFNQRFIVWKLNNTNVDWKNTATLLNCVSARWQDEEERLPISIFWASPCFAGDSESYNPLWNLERSTGHVPHAIANIYYPELSGYFKESKPSSESVPIQEPTPLVRGFKVFYNRRYFLNFRRYLKN